ETHIAGELQCRFEIALGLAREADDEIRADADVRPRGAQLADLFLELERRVAALHEREDAVRPALYRQVQVARKLRHVRVRLDQAVRELERMRRREADALDARHRRDMM